MKWLSIKKYKPPTDRQFFVRIKEIHQDNNPIYYYDLDKYYPGLNHGIFEGKTNFGSTIISVTHFCIPDPIIETEDE